MTEIVFTGMAHDRNIAHQVEPGGVGRDDDHAGLQIGSGLRVGNRHDNGKFRAIRRRGIPFLAVDDIVVAVFDGGGIQHDRVGAGHVHFGHGKTAADFAVHQGLQVFFFLFFGSELMQDLDVAGIRCLTAKDIVSQGRTPQALPKPGRVPSGQAPCRRIPAGGWVPTAPFA